MVQKPSLLMLALAVIGTLSAAPAQAALGPQAGVCARGGLGMLVKVFGLKSRAGTVRVRLFTGDPAKYFYKGNQIARIEAPVPGSGPVEVCVAVPRPGIYAIDVRHDANNNGKTDLADGIGLSGNPKLSLLDVVLKRQPPANQVQVRVAGGTVPVAVVLRYRG